MRRLPTRAMTAAVAASLGITAAAPAQDQRQRLREAKAQSLAAAARSVALDRQAAAERDQARQARAREAAVAARIQRAAADIVAAQARLGILRQLIEQQRIALDQRQGPIVRLMAALQSLARRPALISVVQPGSVTDIVHVRAVLANTLPVIRARTVGIRADLARTRALQADAALATQGLASARADLDTQREALSRLEAEHRQRSRALGRDALFESDRAIALGEQARDIVDLMDQEGDQAATLESLQSLAGPRERPAPLGEVTRSDGLSWDPAAPPYRLPATGRVVTGLGEVSSAGVRSRGLTLETVPGAPVIAPAAGRIAYAGPFRSYGVILIIDHGAGWTTLLSGLYAASLRVGQVVRQGAAVGRATGGDAPRVTVELRRRGRAVDMTPLIG